MKKRILALVLALVFILSISSRVNADNGEINYKKSNNEIITLTEAEELARWFIANDIYENNNDGWSESTVISGIDEGVGYYKDSYIINLENDDDNGYIVISRKISDVLIKEFAYSEKPLFLNLVPLDQNKKAFESKIDVDQNSRLGCTKVNIDQTNENLPYILKVRKYMLRQNLQYGEIKNPYKHVNDKYGSGWKYSDSSTVPGFKSLDMSDFTADNHCTLTTMTAIFDYHRRNGHISIDSDINTLFNRIKKIATDKGYYTPSGGTKPWYIDNLAEAIWDYYGYDGTGDNDFFFLSTKSINKTLKKEIDGNRPGAISFTHGDYGDHTVTYYGYIFYKKPSHSKKMYLKVNDNWTTSARYVDTTHIGTLGETYFEICRVIPWSW